MFLDGLLSPHRVSVELAMAQRKNYEPIVIGKDEDCLPSTSFAAVTPDGTTILLYYQDQRSRIREITASGLRPLAGNISHVPVYGYAPGPSGIAAYVKPHNAGLDGKPSVHLFFQREGGAGEVTEMYRSLEQPGEWKEQHPNGPAGLTKVSKATNAGIAAALVKVEQPESKDETEVLLISE